MMVIYYACALCDKITVFDEGHSGFNQVIENARILRYIGSSGIYASCFLHYIGFSGSKGLEYFSSSIDDFPATLFSVATDHSIQSEIPQG